MKKLTTFLITGILSLGVVACSDANKTSADAPDGTQETPKTLEADEAQDTQADAESEVRRNQLNSDIRAREERNDTTNSGAAENRVDDDVASEVRSKLEANIPASALVVDAKDGMVTVSGTVPAQEQLDKIEPLTKEIKGVQGVTVTATVAQAQPESKQ